MAIKIEVSLENKTALNVEKILKKYLQIIPQEHLLGLERIIVVDRILDKKIKRLEVYIEKNTRPYLLQ